MGNNGTADAGEVRAKPEEPVNNKLEKMVEHILRSAMVSLLMCGCAMATAQSNSLSLVISSKSKVFDAANDIVMVCELRNVGISPVVVEVPNYGSDSWIVDGCYGSLPVPSTDDDKREVVTLDTKGTFRFERRLKFNEENQLRIHTVDGRPIRDRRTRDELWKTPNVGSQPAFGTRKEYAVRLELAIRGVGLVRSNEVIVRLP